MDNYQPGFGCPVAFQVFGQGFVALLNVKSHNLDLSVLLYDVSGTSHNGDTARLAGRRDCAGTVLAEFDADVPPYLNPPNIRPGVSGMMLFYYSNLSLGRPFQVPVVVEKLHFETSTDSESKWSFDVKMNKIVGPLVYPAA